MSFVDLILGNSNERYLGAQGTFKIPSAENGGKASLRTTGRRKMAREAALKMDPHNDWNEERLLCEPPPPGVYFWLYPVFEAVEYGEI